VINPGDVNGLDKNHPDHHLLLGANESGHRGHDGLEIARRSRPLLHKRSPIDSARREGFPGWGEGL
jgi:hypothetical protein